MKNKKLKLILGIIIAVSIVVFNGLYSINEGQQVIITQFGEPVGTAITTAGLHFKTPFIQKINFFEKKILEWDGDADEIPTKDKKNIWVDTTARWQIQDPLKFFKAVFNEKRAHTILDDIIDSAVRDVVTSHNLIELVRSSNRIIDEAAIPSEEEEFMQEEALDKITVGRNKMREEILESAGKTVLQYGIKLVDVRIKRVKYIDKVRRTVFDRMIAERKQAAEKYRSEGRGTRAEIEGETEKELKNVLSQAYKGAQSVKGTADAAAAKIYADAYNKDPEFYSFLKTLETYKNTIDQDTTLILSTDSEYFKYLKEISPNN
ncbi:MAG: protease modulator HflC [Candidatus Omnitrophota bacterium]|nr:protease modulator HflC [Candidatus Omnitrophota bacterium]